MNPAKRRILYFYAGGLAAIALIITGIVMGALCALWSRGSSEITSSAVQAEAQTALSPDSDVSRSPSLSR